MGSCLEAQTKDVISLYKPSGRDFKSRLFMVLICPDCGERDTIEESYGKRFCEPCAKYTSCTPKNSCVNSKHPDCGGKRVDISECRKCGEPWKRERTTDERIHDMARQKNILTMQQAATGEGEDVWEKTCIQLLAERNLIEARRELETIIEQMKANKIPQDRLLFLFIRLIHLSNALEKDYGTSDKAMLIAGRLVEELGGGLDILRYGPDYKFEMEWYDLLTNGLHQHQCPACNGNDNANSSLGEKLCTTCNGRPLITGHDLQRYREDEQDKLSE